MVGYVTTYGNHLGDPRYVLVCDFVAFPLSTKDAIRAQRHGVPYQHGALMTDRERDLAHEAWECRAADRTITIHRCSECGYHEGEEPQGGCCPNCGVGSEPIPVLVSEPASL